MSKQMDPDRIIEVALLSMAAELADKYDADIPSILADHGLRVTIEIAETEGTSEPAGGDDPQRDGNA